MIGSGPGGTAGFDFCYRNLLKENGIFSLQRLVNFPFNLLQDGQVYNAIDYDNDGDLDICLTNYSGAKTRFYRNDAGIYHDITTPFTVQGGLLTNDTNGATTARSLFRNESAATGNHWVQFTLEGRQSNRSAIGAVIRIKATINGQTVWQIREISAHNSFQSQHDLRQHFGIGDAGLIDSLEIRWPSGLVQTFTEIVPDNFFNIIENESIEVVFLDASEPDAAAFEIAPNPVTQSFNIHAMQKIARLELFDLSGKSTAIRYDTSAGDASIQIIGNPPAGNYVLRAIFDNGKFAIKQLVKL